MKTRIVTMYNEEKKAKVVLIGCCHIGSKGYYKKLTDEIIKGSTVLYEGIRDCGDVKMDYTKLAEALRMCSQKDCIDYSDESWINSDGSFKNFSKHTQEYVKNTCLLIDTLGNAIDEGDLMGTLGTIGRFAGLNVREKLYNMYKYFSFNNPDILEDRNFIVAEDIIRYTDISKDAPSVVSVLYGEAHLKGIIKILKHMDFCIQDVKKIIAL